MDLIADRGRRVTVDELNTSKLLAHAAEQARERKYEDMMIVDCDAHHYENEHMSEILPFMDNDVQRQLAMAGNSRRQGSGSVIPGQVGYQDVGGRVTVDDVQTNFQMPQTVEHVGDLFEPLLHQARIRRTRLPVRGLFQLPEHDVLEHICGPLLRDDHRGFPDTARGHRP